MSDVETYPGRHLAIKSDGKRCIHSRYCVLNLPDVFVPNVEGPWIHPDAASTEAAIAVITKCPSGALGYEPVGDTPAEGAPGVNTVRVWEDGPLAFHAELRVGVDEGHRRATLCRCGLSQNKPYCDHSHEAGKFRATGEPESRASDALAVRDGPLNVTPQKNGPLMIEGALEICAASGRTVSRETKVWLCRCGHSQDKPFCDGSHKAAGFVG
jgi:CDGSH-type Zn-finger protein/uncharacterized Fe-S cluster protein YjdI